MSEATPVAHVVDDDESIRALWQWLMDSRVVAVRTYASAAEFMAAHRDEGPACLVLDLKLPDMNGLELQKSLTARGVGVTIGRRFGHAGDGSVSYTYGHSSRMAGVSGEPGVSRALAFRDNDFHDFVARLQAVLRATDTRIAAFCRMNTLAPDAEGPGTEADRFTRFDVQLSQGIPFIGELTRADWELLLAYRNLFYEVSEGGTLDELSVVNPPTRMLGGITVRF